MAEAASTADPPTVLVVDDEPSVRMLVGRMLTEAGYRVLTAMNGPDALQTLRTSGPVQVLLSDLRMPQMTGVQLATEVRQLLPAARVLLMAAFPSEDPLAWPVVVKPFPPGLLETEIRRILADEPRT
jgi:CheY-like chemotaxis protein